MTTRPFDNPEELAELYAVSPQERFYHVTKHVMERLRGQVVDAPPAVVESIIPPAFAELWIDYAIHHPEQALWWQQTLGDLNNADDAPHKEFMDWLSRVLAVNPEAAP